MDIVIRCNILDEDIEIFELLLYYATNGDYDIITNKQDEYVPEVSELLFIIPQSYENEINEIIEAFESELD